MSAIDLALSVYSLPAVSLALDLFYRPGLRVFTRPFYHSSKEASRASSPPGRVEEIREGRINSEARISAFLYRYRIAFSASRRSKEVTHSRSPSLGLCTGLSRALRTFFKSRPRARRKRPPCSPHTSSSCSSARSRSSSSSNSASAAAASARCFSRSARSAASWSARAASASAVAWIALRASSSLAFFSAPHASRWPRRRPSSAAFFKTETRFEKQGRLDLGSSGGGLTPQDERPRHHRKTQERISHSAQPCKDPKKVGRWG